MESKGIAGYSLSSLRTILEQYEQAAEIVRKTAGLVGRYSYPLECQLDQTDGIIRDAIRQREERLLQDMEAPGG